MNENNTHRLTETAAAEMYGTDEEGHTLYAWRNPERAWVVRAMGAAFDAGREHERTTPEDALPWEPLNGRPLRVGDEVRQELRNLTITAVVARVGADGDLWAAEDEFIGRLNIGTWYVRRAIQELPTEDGAVIVPAEGFKYIGGEGGRLFARLTYSGQLRLWYGVVVEGGPAWAALWYGEPEQITPGTWKKP